MILAFCKCVRNTPWVKISKRRERKQNNEASVPCVIRLARFGNCARTERLVLPRVRSYARYVTCYYHTKPLHVLDRSLPCAERGRGRVKIARECFPRDRHTAEDECMPVLCVFCVDALLFRPDPAVFYSVFYSHSDGGVSSARLLRCSVAGRTRA